MPRLLPAARADFSLCLPTQKSSRLRLNGEKLMNEAKLRYLKIALVVVGVACFAIYPLSMIWPSGWKWHDEGQSLYFQMIISVYATLGVFLLIAARNPLQHVTIIWFAAWSSIVHAAVMAAQSLVLPQHHGHLMGDVPILLVAGVVLAWLAPRRPALAATAG